MSLQLPVIALPQAIISACRSRSVLITQLTLPCYNFSAVVRSDEGSHALKLNVITLAIIFIGLFLFIGHAAHLPWTPNRIAGLAIAAPAFVGLITARMQLGAAFSVRPKASFLVTSGIYSRIRNPIYVFSTLMLLGLIIWTGRPWLLVFLALLVPMQILRARKEQAVLAEKFGEEYAEYKRQTWC